MTDKKQILVVDDSPNEIRVLMENLKKDYAVVAATSGEMAISTVQTSQPDLILLDVMMEPMDGYEACRILHRDYPQIPVIFVSANTQTEEILKGFDAGGQDYITKPIVPDVLKSKINIALEQLERSKQLQNEKQEVSDLAMAAMSSAGDLSIVLNFLRTTTRLSGSQALAQALSNSIGEYGLKASVQIRGPKGVIANAANTVEVTPLEADILSSSVNIEGRILEKGRRLIVVYDAVSMLVKNLPEDNQKRAGELRDYLMILAENADALNRKMKEDQNIADQRIAVVLEAVKDAKDTLSSIQAFQIQYKEDSIRIMDELLEEVEANFFSMGLTEAQEKMITDMIQKKLNEGVTHMEQGLQVDAKLQNLADNLGELTRKL